MVCSRQMKNRLLLIIPNLGPGGAQVVFRDQLHYYSEQYDVVGCVFNWDDSFAEDRNPNIVSLNIPAGGSALTKIYFFWKRIFSLRKLKKQLNVAISISHLEGADYVNILSRNEERVITWIHGTKQFDENIAGILGVLRKKILIPILYKQSDMIVVVSNGIKKELIHHFKLMPEMITTVNNGISIADILVNSKKEISSDYLRLAKNYSILIAHCRLAKQKNLNALLDIMASLPRNASIKLVILGDGELREILLKRCLFLNLSVFSIWNGEPWKDNLDVYFLGHQHNPYPFLKHATLYMMTSLWEGFPLSLCESLACGLPMMASDCYTGPREILCPELTPGEPLLIPYISSCGILMPIPNSKNQISVWSKTIMTIINNGELRSALSTAALKRSRDFDRNTVEDQWRKNIST